MATFLLTITKSESFPIIIYDYSFIRNMYFGWSMLEVICGNCRMKKTKNYKYNILKHDSLNSNFLHKITKSRSFTIIINNSSLMRNLYFGCSMLEVICGNRQKKKLEKCRYSILKCNSLYSNFLPKI